MSRPVPPSSLSNQARAKATADALAELHSPRLAASVVDALVHGVEASRTSSGLGQEGVLGKAQALQAAQALIELPQDAFERVDALLALAGGGAGADAQTERALILKALAVRSSAMATSALARERALEQVEWFAAEIRGDDRDEVVLQTSVVDLDDRVNSSEVKPTDVLGGADGRADNDGYVQRFQDSCVPASVAIMRGELDPVFALAANRNGLQDLDPTTPEAVNERDILGRGGFYDQKTGLRVQLTQDQFTAYVERGELPAGVGYVSGGATESRVGHAIRERLVSAIRRAKSDGTLTEEAAFLLLRITEGYLPSDGERERALAALATVRAANAGFPSDGALSVMSSDQRMGPRGMSAGIVLADLREDVSGPRYVGFRVVQTMPATHLDMLAAAIASGDDLLISMGTVGIPGGHVVVLTDVRPQGNGRAFLVSDPWSGRSAWVDERALADPKSGWPKEFDLGWDGIRAVFIPERDAWDDARLSDDAPFNHLALSEFAS